MDTQNVVGTDGSPPGTTKRCDEGASGRSSKRCPVGGEPCEVVALLSEYLEEVPQEASIWECLPCSRCRVGLQAIHGLKGTRLGRHERRILLEAAPPEAHPKRIAPEDESRSSYEALQRARRKLHGAGLLEVTTEAPVRIRLTPAGQALLSTLRKPLEAGKPIRWTPRSPLYHHSDGTDETLRLVWGSVRSRPEAGPPAEVLPAITPPTPLRSTPRSPTARHRTGRGRVLTSPPGRVERPTVCLGDLAGGCCWLL